jgi:hypothetical protein
MSEIEHRPSGRRSWQSGRDRFAAARLLAAWVRRGAAVLDPGCFALVMATGIVSNSLFLEGYPATSNTLLAVNLVVYPWLCLLTGWRAARFGAALRGDLLDPGMVFS